MRHPAAILTSLAPVRELRGNRYALIGKNEFVRRVFIQELTTRSTTMNTVWMDPADLRASALLIQNDLQTTPAWENPLMVIQDGHLLFTNMAFPEDLPPSRQSVVVIHEPESSYVPSSFTPVDTEIKGQALQDFIRWMMQRRNLNGEPDVVKFLASEYKDDLLALDKELEATALTIHPRTVIALKDLEAAKDDGWDSTRLLIAIVAGDEIKMLAEMNQALETFHPKGILTVMSRRITLLMLVSSASIKSNGQQPDSSQVKPWVWRQNSELAREIPLKRMAQWAVTLDKAYSLLSRGAVNYRYTLMTALLDMTRVTV